LAILDFMASRPTEAFSLTELARALNINAASTHAVLAAMTGAGYLIRHPTHKTYRLGPSTMAVGHAALESHPVIGAARAEMERLAAELDLECVASAPLARELVVVGSVGRPHRFGPLVRVGQRLALIPPLGIMYVAWSSSKEVDEWLKRANGSPGDESLYRRYLASARALGYTVGVVTEGGSVPVQSTEGNPGELQLDPGRTYEVTYIATSTFDHHGQVSLVINLDGFEKPMSPGEIEWYAGRLKAAGIAVTRSVHGSSPLDLDEARAIS
jgi:DNA-binding IclR family transcriptional regulator